MGFRRAFGILLTAASSILVVASIGLRYAAWPGGAVTDAAQYWLDITLTESWAWVAMFVTGLCIVIADHEDGSHTPKGGPIG